MPIGIVWELYQQGKIRDAQATADSAHAEAIGAQMVLPQLEALRQRVEQLERWDGAVWSLLKEKLAFTDADLVRRLEALRPEPVVPPGERPNCSACGAKVVPELNHCQICGASIARS